MSLEQAILSLTAELKRYNDASRDTNTGKPAIVRWAEAGSETTYDPAAPEASAKAALDYDKLAADQAAAEAKAAKAVEAKAAKAKAAKEAAEKAASSNPYSTFGFDAEHVKAISKLQTELKLEPQGAAQKFTSDAVLAAVPKLGRDPVVAALQSAAGAAKVSAADPSKLGAIYAAIAQLVAEKESAPEDLG